jgi:prevent-host-death family protein
MICPNQARWPLARPSSNEILQNMRIIRIMRIMQEFFDMPLDETVTVSAAEFHRNIGRYQDIALTKPVAITKNGRERTVLLSAEEYHRLKRRDRRVIVASDLTDEEIEAIANSRMDPKYDHLNEELKDWKP